MNEAWIDLGMGKYKWLVFLTTGPGWFVDNMRANITLSIICHFWMQPITIISPPVQREFAVNQIAF
ncbi:hypothetical protein N7532_004757 [Penicillium argentinense]|uniref:Uncharacterized protein n=1 Tax=Penicillium argentinense TaxID=1131581 RepID=A0A9W9FPX2_9EURO|nr:uncharacterized protein N7532_004757 [Penicillium argentinense]KAJ5104228.1 hypothetical protein N7532_004757 [Penicillium argentinense]